MFKFMTIPLMVLSLMCLTPDLPARDDIGTAENARMVLENFKMRGMAPDGRKQWDLHGAKAIVEGPLANLEDALVVFYTAENEKFDITSPHCTFNRITKIGGSEAPLHAQGRTITIDGVGYDIFASEQRLHIRSQVKMKIKEAKGLLDEEKIFGNRDRKMPAPTTDKPPAEGAK